MDATFCSVEEGGITPGCAGLSALQWRREHRDADIVVGDPNVHVANTMLV